MPFDFSLANVQADMWCRVSLTCHIGESVNQNLPKHVWVNGEISQALGRPNACVGVRWVIDEFHRGRLSFMWKKTPLSRRSYVAAPLKKCGSRFCVNMWTQAQFCHNKCFILKCDFDSFECWSLIVTQASVNRLQHPELSLCWVSCTDVIFLLSL